MPTFNVHMQVINRKRSAKINLVEIFFLKRVLLLLLGKIKIRHLADCFFINSSNFGRIITFLPDK